MIPLQYICHVLQASALLVECIATFTCTELCTYKQFMFYALATSVISLNRNELRQKVNIFFNIYIDEA